MSELVSASLTATCYRPDRVEHYPLSSRSGFKRSVEEAGDEPEDLRLFTVDDVADALAT